MVGTQIPSIILPDNTELAWIATAVVLLGCGMLSADMLAHRNVLCEYCAERMPLNPTEVAERRRRWLRLFHWHRATKWRGLLVLLAIVVIAWGFLFLTNEWTGNVAWLLFFCIPTAVLMTAEKHHHRLSPWCPYCRRGRGDDEETIKTPDPSPASA